MNKLFAGLVSGVSLVGLLGGCSMFSNSNVLYKEAGVMEPMRVPEGVTTAPIESAYAIPNIEASEFDYVDTDEKLSVPRPSPMSQDAEFARVKIQKVGERRWVLAEAPTSQIWPLVQSFLARNGILVARAQPKTGEIETGWLSFKVDADTQSRYLVRIEKGVRENSSEVHVLHQQIAKGATSTQWPAESSDAERESWMLDELAASVAEGISNRAASLLGQSVGGEEKISLRSDGGEPVIDIRLDAQRAQATLAHALNQDGLKIWVEESEYGVFYFGYDNPNDEPGLWEKMTFRGNDDLPEESPAELPDLLASMAPASSPVFADILGFGTADSGEPILGYLLRAQPQGDLITVRVRNTRGEPLPYREAKRLMVVIRRNLI